MKGIDETQTQGLLTPNDCTINNYTVLLKFLDFVMMMYFNLCLVKLSYKNYTTHMFIMTQISPSKQKHKNKFSLNM